MEMNETGRIHIRNKWGRLMRDWMAITLLCFLLFELESLPQGIREIIENKEELIINGVFSAIFSLSSLLICRLVYHNRIIDFHMANYRRWSFILVVAINFVLSLLLSWIYNIIFPDYAFTDTTEDILESAIITAMCSLVIVVQNYSKIISEYEKKERRGRLEMLKFQLNPHFIFNSMSILAGLIETSPKSAERFTLDMSRVYRYITRNIGADFVSVSEAVAFAKDYTTMLEMRFPECLVFTLKGNAVEGNIPSMAMQLLIENAVKHNPPEKYNKLYITIAVDRQCITVSNNVSRDFHDKCEIKQSGIGLDNLVKQYELLSDKHVEILRTDNCFTVKLPIINKKRQS